MEPQTIVLLDSTYEQYKKMWEDMILSYTKSQPESHNIDAKIRGVFKLIKTATGVVSAVKVLTKGLMKWIIKKAYKIFSLLL